MLKISALQPVKVVNPGVQSVILLHQPEQLRQCKGQRTRSIPVQHMISIHMAQAAIKLPLYPTKCKKKKKKNRARNLTCSRWSRSFLLESCLQIQNWSQREKRASSPPVVWIFPQRVRAVQQRWQRLFLATLRHTLYTGAERRAAPKLPEFCNWFQRNPTSLCHVDWCFICLVTPRWWFYTTWRYVRFVILTWWPLWHYSA